MGKTPIRIQRRRTRGWRLPEGARCVTRPGKFGNPFKGEHAVDEYLKWLGTTTKGAKIVEDARRELRGKNLACFCPIGKRCHADILLEIANQPEVAAHG